MSDNKKVIHVKDLVIKADNVHIESERRPHRPDPFFGFGPRMRREEAETEAELTSTESVDESEEDHDRDERRPFSWI